MAIAALGVLLGLLVLLLMVGAVALTVAIIIWSWRIAKGKGYPGLLGVALTVFFHLLGFIVLLLLPRRETIERTLGGGAGSGSSPTGPAS